MKEWKEYKLGELIDLSIANLQTGPFGTMLNASEYSSDGVPVIAVQDIGDNKLVYHKFVYVPNETAERLTRYRVKEFDIIFGRKGAVDRRALIKKSEEGWLQGSDCIRLRFTNEINAKYISYQLGSDSHKDWMFQFATGATMPSLNQEILKLLPIKLPTLPEQTAIATILSSLDDKIDLLHRQNKTLEGLAEVVFKEWFVEGAREEWEIDILGNVFDIGIGRTPPRKEQHWFTLSPDDVKWVSIKDMGISGVYIDSVSEYLTQEAVKRFSIPVIPANTVLLSFKMTIGRLAITTEKMLSNEAIAHFKLKEGSSLFPEFLYLYLKTYKWEQLGSTSSIVESINSQMIKDMELVIPDDMKLNEFKVFIKPLFEKIRSNQTQIRTLTQTRDGLLPRLMSGEVRVGV